MLFHKYLIQFVVRFSFPIQLSSSSNDSVYGKLENYEIEKKIGKGQFSVVYRARCLAVSEESDDPPIVALKKVQIFEMMDAKARLDCMKEIQLLQVYSRIYRKVRVLFIILIFNPFLSNTKFSFIIAAIKSSECDQVPGIIYRGK